MTREQAKEKIKELVERYREHRNEYHAADYNETKTRIGYINPFFTALGWDVDHKEDVMESLREVIHEDKVKVHGKVKAPDYGFRIAGQTDKRLFFVEAKKPSVSLKTNREAAYQLRRYGRSAQAPVSILTNFEEFIIYDCTKRPNQNDSAGVARIGSVIRFEDYLENFDFIYDTFSREAVYKGRFEKFVLSDTYKKGTQTLDKDFVESLDAWRKYLAVSIALNNKKLNEEEINFAVQQTIDRLIFLRFCEDRGIEAYAQLQAAASKGDTYKNLFDIFKQADDKYNSGLFDFKKDTISANLKIDNKVLKEVITQLYYPDCEYDFRVMPVEVLGNAYEQFLGKVIRITASHSAKIEEKPEVRKAGGVFYTPQYIVEYIVKNTVGKLIEGKSPKEIEKIKIVDPACGSGSFLLGTYQFLLNYHVNYYHNKGFADKKTKDNPLAPNGTLATHEKKKILLNNIFGVDLDTNAVEVTKLSLLLKCMEGETEASIKQQLSVFHERVLPSLENNIKDGNSLIDTDFYDSEIDLGYERKIKPFSWKKGFPNVFKQGGFDAVIGNPPYVRSQFIEKYSKDYFQKIYVSASYQPDTFAFFIERGITLLKNNGELGFIIPNGILTNNYYSKLRKYIIDSTAIKIIVDLKDNVFDGASVDTSIFILQRETNTKKAYTNITYIGECPSKKILNVITPTSNITQSKFLELNDFVFNTSIDEKSFSLINKITINTTPLKDYLDIKNGMKVRVELFGNKKIDSRYKKFLQGGDIKPFSTNYSNKWVCYDKKLESKYSNQAFRDEEIFTSPSKLLIRQVLGKKKIYATIDNDCFYVDQSIYILLPKNKNVNLKTILGIINSKMMFYFFSKTFSDRKETFPKIKGIQIAEFPIKPLLKSENEEIAKHVDSLLKLNEELKEVKLQSKIEQLKQRIEHSEEKIDQLVYELYELDENDIKIIEGSSGQ